MKRALGAIVTMVAVMLLGATAEARHVAVTYVDANRPPEFSQADVVAAIRRVMREWEAHNANSALVLHWNGIIQLHEAASDYNNLVIRWAPSDYTDFRAVGCSDGLGCDWPWSDPSIPLGHILLASHWDSVGTSYQARWNNPRWNWDRSVTQDMVSVLMHEMGHFFLDAGEASQNSPTIMRMAADHTSRSLFNSDINGVYSERYPGHYQTLQMFSIDPNNGSAYWIGQSTPPFRVRSPASLATGNGVGATGDYTIAYATRTPADSPGQNNAFVVRLTDGNSNHLGNRSAPNSIGEALGGNERGRREAA